MTKEAGQRTFSTRHIETLACQAYGRVQECALPDSGVRLGVESWYLRVVFG